MTSLQTRPGDPSSKIRLSIRQNKDHLFQRQSGMRKGDCSQHKRDILLLAHRIAELPRVQKKVLAMYYHENFQIPASLGLTENEVDLIRAQTVKLLQTNFLRDLKQPDN
jgi:hypothetical protein